MKHNGKEVERWLEEGNKVIVNGVSKGIRFATHLFERGAAREAPVDSGVLRGEIESTFTSTMGKVFTSTEYAKFVHEGTRPHKVSGKHLEGWARKKGLNPYAVAKSISKKGTKANPFFTRAIKKNKNKAMKLFEKEIDKAIDSMDRK